MGNTLSLFETELLIFALLVASYSGRNTWLALCSMVMSLAVVFGCFLLAMTHDQAQVRTRLAWIEAKLPLVLDQQTADKLATAIDRLAPASPCEAGQQGCSTAASAASLSTEPSAVPPPATSGGLDKKPDLKATSQYPVAWNLDDRNAGLPPTSPRVFSISGTNVADQALEDVHAVLKPDATEVEMKLALDVEGPALEGGSVIPPEARFSLTSTSPYQDGAKQAGGAILTFRYVQAGRRKTSILYLTPATISRLAGRE